MDRRDLSISAAAAIASRPKPEQARILQRGGTVLGCRLHDYPRELQNWIDYGLLEAEMVGTTAGGGLRREFTDDEAAHAEVFWRRR
jgi:hypothetical protein